MNGSWLPTKALGGGKVSASPLSSSMSSKLLVSMSPLSSGTTGATAGRQKRSRDGGEGEEEQTNMCYIN